MSTLLVATLASTVLLAAVLGYLYANAGSRYLLDWTIHWGLIGVGLALTLVVGVGPGLAPAVRHLVMLGSALFLYRGSLALQGRRAPAVAWVVVGAVAVWILTSPLRDVSFTVEHLPTYWLRGGLTVWAGILLLRLPKEYGIERYVPGWAFILDGLHLADYPFLGQSEAVMPWALVASMSIRFVIGIGMLLLYFRKTRNAGEQSERRFRSAFDLSPVAMTISEDSGTVVEANQAMLDVVGFKPGELVGRSTSEARIWEDPGQREDLVRQVLEQGRVEDYRVEMRHKSGEVRQVSLAASAIATDEKPALLIMGRDVTEQVRAEARIRRLVGVLEATPDVVGIWDRSGVAIYLNGAARDLLGMDPDADLAGVRAEGLVSPDLFQTAVRGCLAAGSWTGETVLFGADERQHEVSLAVIRHLDGQGDVSHFSTLARDISDMRSLQAQLLQSQKLEAMGRLAGGVAHDFNNLLTVIGGYAESLEADSPTAELRRGASEIRRAQERAAGLTRQLLAFARRQDADPRTIDLDRTLLALDSLLRRLIGADVSLEVAPASDASVHIDPTHLDQAVINLVVNARDAVEEGGSIRVSARTETLGEGERSPFPELTEGTYAVVCVEDDGTGMHQDVMDRLFEPFFTTKEPGQGTGLGLSTVFGIIEQAGGAIRVHSQPGEGACFEMALPVVEARSTGAAEGALRPRAPGEPLRILVVEDDPAVRSLVVRHLASEGHQIREASNGREAVEAFGEGQPLDLLVSDVVMPEMGGGVLVERFRERYPAGGVVLMSGYADQRIRPGLLNEPGIRFLSKPFRRGELLAAVQEVTGA